MLFNNTLYIGIDPTAGQKPFTYAALSQDLHVQVLGLGGLEDVLAFAAGQRRACIGVSAPRRPNLGLLAREEVRQALPNPPRPGRWTGFRLVEYQLRQHNISSPQTYAQEDSCPGWMQSGFKLHNRLEKLGYQPYPADEGELQALEIYPHASFTVLLGMAPFPKYSLEGRVQRQLALLEQKVLVPDPMRIFEEITRHWLMKGVLPIENLYSPGELDALVGAYTAWLATNHPDRITALGDCDEGQVILPAAALKSRY